MEPVLKSVMECQQYRTGRGNDNLYNNYSSMINRVIGMSLGSENFGDMAQNELWPGHSRETKFQLYYILSP